MNRKAWQALEDVCNEIDNPDTGNDTAPGATVKEEIKRYKEKNKSKEVEKEPEEMTEITEDEESEEIEDEEE